MKVITFNSNSGVARKHVFYVLNKGLNSGRPMSRPCANCFIVICADDEQRRKYYNYVYLLWKCEKFNECLVGSVIPFLRLPDFRKVVLETVRHKEINHFMLKDTILSVISLKQHQEILIDKINKLKVMEKAIIRNYIKI